MKTKWLMALTLTLWIGQAHAQNLTDAQKELIAEKLGGTWKSAIDMGTSVLQTSIKFDPRDKGTGAIKIKIANASVEGNFKVLSDKTLEITLRRGKLIRKRTTTFEIKNEELTLKDSQGKMESFRRVTE